MSLEAFFKDPISGWIPALGSVPDWNGDPDRFMTFPAGERHVIEGRYPFEVTDGLIVIHGTDANDYVSAAMWIDLMHQRGVRVAAAVPYLPGARQDRGRPLGAQVYANLINSMGADQVLTLDPHSSAMPELIDNLKIVPLQAVLHHALVAHPYPEDARNYVGVIAPDKGAIERAHRASYVLGIPVYQATKERDFDTGTLSRFECEELPETGRLLVVDDICDGGGTFRGLARATGLGPDRLDLWVTHGVFSGNPTASLHLAGHFGSIYTTDSHPGHTNKFVDAKIQPLFALMADAVDLRVTG